MTTLGERPVGTGTHGAPGDGDPTRVFNLFAPLNPAAAVTARSVRDVRDAIARARAEGLGVRVHATGHASATARPMEDSLLIRTALEGGVGIDARRRVARVPAGTRWGEVVDAAAPHGLAAAHGSSPTVGAVGYLLNGGLSMYARYTGLAANSVLAVELVTADGELRRVDAEHDPDLFWAVRGGGGGFGVVTAVEIALFPVAGVITGAAFWPAEHAARLLARWQRWTLDAPSEATTSVRVMNLPKLPELPAALTAGTVVCLDGVVVAPHGDDLAAARRMCDGLLAPLREVADPLVDTWHEAGPAAVPDTHMDPPEPVPVLGDHLLLDELGEEGVAEFLRVTAGRADQALTVAELRQLGGALSRGTPASGALGRIDARYAYSGAGVPGDAAGEKRIRDHCALVRRALSPWDTGRTAPTFVATPEQPQGHLDADDVRAVDRVRSRVDPSGLFRGDVAPGCSAS